MKSAKVKPVEAKEFNDIYYQAKLKKDKTWQALFNDTIKQIENFSSSSYFWYIADFAKGVVKAGGNVETATPLSKTEWVGLHPWDIGKLFHPMDLGKMQAFIVFVAGFLAGKTDKQRKNIKISLVFRMLTAEKNYTWRVMEYPAMHYVNNQPVYLLCHVKEIQHLLDQPKCVMYVLDANEAEPTMYYCDEEKINLKPVAPQKKLSAREIEVVKLLAKGLISKEIAHVMAISKNTVENHKQNIYQKTGTKKINELIMYASKYIIGEDDL